MRTASLFARLILVPALVCASLSQAAPQLIAGTFDPPRVAPDFELQHSNGGTLKLSDHRGKVILLGFGFTSCPDVCPTTLATLAQAHKKLGEQADDVQVIYITVDPQTDTAAQMKKYLANFDATFIGGTGSEAQLSEVRKQYGILAQKKHFGSNYTYAHSTYVYLIDRNGKLRALMPYGHKPDDFAHDVRALLAE